jgi:hypothetical protein
MKNLSLFLKMLLCNSIDIKAGYHTGKKVVSLYRYVVFVATGVQGGCTGVDQVDKSVLRVAFRLPSRHPFHRIRTPVGTHIGKHRRGVGEQATHLKKARCGLI